MIICFVALPLQDALHKQFGSKCEKRQKRSFGLVQQRDMGCGDNLLVSKVVTACAVSQGGTEEQLFSSFMQGQPSASSCSVLCPLKLNCHVCNSEWVGADLWGKAWAGKSKNLCFSSLKTELWLADQGKAKPLPLMWGFCDSSHFLSLQPSLIYKNLSGRMLNQLLLLWLNLALSRSVMLKEERQILVHPW